MPEQANANITVQEATARWKLIRENPKCDLSLSAAAVAGYLATPESQLVQERIRESLLQLVRYRLPPAVAYLSYDPTKPGELATCEGLETFLVPAVEEAVSLSSVLMALGPEERAAFSATFVADVNGLLNRWNDNVFPGEPYADENEIGDSLLPTRDRTVNIVEAAAMACRVLIHLLTLKLNRTNEEEFQQKIGKNIDVKRLFPALENAIEFLIRSFQKAEAKTEEQAISHACVAGKPGSGWSWTDWPGLPPMLFFTAAAVDAFAELDLYLVRAVRGRNLSKGPDWQQLADFYNKLEPRFVTLQFCVDMARRWVQTGALPFLRDNAGMYPEDGIVFKPQKEVSAVLMAELRSEGLDLHPTHLYNNLYALQVLLWSWADWDDRGQTQNESAKSDINRALTQLIYNYDSVAAVKSILKMSEYAIYLPRHDKFQKSSATQLDYLDKGFLPLLTRLLVLFAVYGVGDRNLLEPVIRNLYVELLQSRNRKNPKYSALWSTEGVEVFATQRAIQALTFYFAYARGKEKAQGVVDRGSGSHSALDDSNELVIFRNRTGRPLVLEALGSLAEAEEPPRSNDPVLPFPDPSQAPDWSAYIRLLNITLAAIVTDESEDLRKRAAAKGKALFAQLKAGELKDADLAKAVVYSLACLYGAPAINDRTRDLEFASLMELARELGAP